MFGSIVRQARESRGLTQLQVAEMSGIAQANISAIERDRREPSATTLHHLLATCGFRLVAEGGSVTIPIPVNPEDHEGDADRGEVVPARTARDRNRQLMAVLEMTDAVMAAKREVR